MDDTIMVSTAGLSAGFKVKRVRTLVYKQKYERKYIEAVHVCHL
jgi:hypothetical protein